MRMTDRLTLQRFADLAQAYGGVIERWPASDQVVARDMAQTDEGAAILADALTLDHALDAWRVPLPDAQLAQRIAASAPHAPKLRPAKLRVRIGLWWSGIGAAAALAGAVAGFATVTLATPHDAAVSADTSFGDLADKDS